MRSVILVVPVLLVILLACSGELPLEPAPGPAPATVAPVDLSRPSSKGEILAFFRRQIEICNNWNQEVGNTGPGELAFDGGPNDPTRELKVVQHELQWGIVQDANGDRLLVDLAVGQVFPVEGAPYLPTKYQFCPSEIFRGPAGD